MIWLLLVPPQKDNREKFGRSISAPLRSQALKATRPSVPYRGQYEDRTGEESGEDLESRILKLQKRIENGMSPSTGLPLTEGEKAELSKVRHFTSPSNRKDLEQSI